MIARVRAKFAEGVLKPLDHLDLEDGCEVVLSIIEDGGSSTGYPLESQREAAQRLIAMGGSAPTIEDIPRRQGNHLPEPGRADGEDGL